MQTQHTPGPWHWIGDSLTHRQFDIHAPRQSPQQHICTVNNLSIEKLYTRDAGVALANARLIAAAPDLLAALQALVGEADLGEVDLDDADRALLDNARAAIAKATGQA